MNYEYFIRLILLVFVAQIYIVPNFKIVVSVVRILQQKRQPYFQINDSNLIKNTTNGLMLYCTIFTQSCSMIQQSSIKVTNSIYFIRKSIIQQTVVRINTETVCIQYSSYALAHLLMDLKKKKKLLNFSCIQNEMECTLPFIHMKKKIFLILYTH